MKWKKLETQELDYITVYPEVYIKSNDNQEHQVFLRFVKSKKEKQTPWYLDIVNIDYSYVPKFYS